MLLEVGRYLKENWKMKEQRKRSGGSHIAFNILHFALAFCIGKIH